MCQDCSDNSIPQGPIGLTGATGPQGPPGDTGTGTSGIVLYNNILDDTTISSTMTTLKSFTVSSNQLSTDGDYLEVVFHLATVIKSAEEKNYQILINGTVCHSLVPLFKILEQGVLSRLCLRINRKTSTKTFLDFTYMSMMYRGVYSVTNPIGEFFEGFSVSNLSSNTLTIAIQACNPNGTIVEEITCSQMVVTYFKKA